MDQAVRDRDSRGISMGPADFFLLASSTGVKKSVQTLLWRPYIRLGRRVMTSRMCSELRTKVSRFARQDTRVSGDVSASGLTSSRSVTGFVEEPCTQVPEQ